MDNPEPNPNIQNLHKQYILLLKQNERFSDSEAEAMIKHRIGRLQSLREVNTDKLSFIMKTESFTDEDMYIYLIKIELEKSKKITDFQRQR
ncbi:MAG: hypothetical protein IJ638_03705 [Alphaproteobacteria bacterium]|nr:hypothetical protein [Alphaproteobacteria bacterium]